jgi:hypothetical protein
MIDPLKTPKGTLVRHITECYTGRFDGVTRMRELFEKPNDSEGCRVLVQLGRESKCLIASAVNLETLEGLALEERHKAILSSYGLEWKGVSPAAPESIRRTRRITKCWLCKGQLDSAVDLNCNACGWLLCHCGACGCGYAVCSP